MDWVYFPKCIPDPNVFKNLYEETLPYLIKRTGGRYSCVISDTPIKLYDVVENQEWKMCPTLVLIKQRLELLVGESFDYCLVHLYVDGNSSIAWHYDTEALNSKIGSFSFGTPRKFRYRKRGQTRGWDYEYVLNSGDLVLMLNDCQKNWEHHIPKETRITTPRINCTFRQFEKLNDQH